MPVAVLLPLILQAITLGLPVAESMFDTAKKELDGMKGNNLTDADRAEIDRAVTAMSNAVAAAGPRPA